MIARLVRLLLVGALALALSACNDSRTGNVMTLSPSPLPPMKTHCIGRYLIDLPEGFTLTPLSDVDLIYGLDENWRRVKVMVPRTDAGSSELKVLASKKAAELAGRFSDETPSKNFLESARTIDADTSLIRAHEEPEMQGYFRITAFSKKETAIGQFQADAFKKDKLEDIEAKVLAVAQRTHYVSEPTQAGKGTCIGPLLIDAGQDGEKFRVTFLSESLPAVFISIDMKSLQDKAEDGGLLSRVQKDAAVVGTLGSKLDPIRSGKTLIASRPAEEFLHRHHDQDHDINYRYFMAEVRQDKPATFGEPTFSIEMSMGGRHPPASEYLTAPMSESDAVALWDTIVKSIRPRPGAF